MKICSTLTQKNKNNYDFLLEFLVFSRFRTLCMFNYNRLQDKSRCLVTVLMKILKLGTYFTET